MTILFIIFAVAFTVAMVVLTVRPFSQSRGEQLTYELLDEDERRVEALVARKVSLVQSLRDIEYDWETNKISEEDYQRFKKSCERQAVGIMRRLDALHGGDRNWDEVIDRAVKRRLDSDAMSPADLLANGEPSPPDDAPPATDDHDDDQPPHCTNCDARLDPGDRFCSRCGTAVGDDDDSLPAASPEDLDTPPSSPPSEVAG